MSSIEEITQGIIEGSITPLNARKAATQVPDLLPSEVKKLIQRSIKVSQASMLFNKMKAEKNGAVFGNLPSIEDWVSVSMSPPIEQARWYLENLPEEGKPYRPVFRKLCKRFGLEGNAFFACVRIVRREL